MKRKNQNEKNQLEEKETAIAVSILILLWVLVILFDPPIVHNASPHPREPTTGTCVEQMMGEEKDLIAVKTRLCTRNEYFNTSANL